MEFDPFRIALIVQRSPTPLGSEEVLRGKGSRAAAQRVTLWPSPQRQAHHVLIRSTARMERRGRASPHGDFPNSILIKSGGTAASTRNQPRDTLPLNSVWADKEGNRGVRLLRHDSVASKNDVAFLHTRTSTLWFGDRELDGLDSPCERFNYRVDAFG